MAPLTAPVLAAATSGWMMFAPNNGIFVALTVLLWLTFLVGFVGLGMHLRGLGRQMGGFFAAV